jgi:hypothetical protein
MPIKQPVKRNVPGAEAAAAGEETAAPKKPPVKRAATSLEDAFDEAKPGGGFMAVGKHRAFITEMTLEEPNEKGTSAKVTYEGSPESDNEEVHGKSLSQWYKLLDKDGVPAQGLGFLKRDLEILGYADVKGSEMEDTFALIVADRPEVIIQVKQNGQFTNAYLNGLVEQPE